MSRTLRTIVLAATAGLLLARTATAAPTPASGTLSPLTPLLTYGDGPITGANPTNNVPGSNGPNCSAVPGTCSDYTLTVSIPAGYTALHPNHVVTIKVQWPTATVNDFDLYILDPISGAVARPGSATSADPEIASFPVTDGTNTFLLRTAAYQAANETYTATITLGAPSTQTVGLGNSYTVGTDVYACNTHLGTTNPAGPPPVFDQNLDGEPLTAFDANGRFYVSALAGIPAGCGVWYSDDACGQAYTFVGAPDLGLGGGDAEIRTAPEKNLLGYYNVYTSSLTLANITSSVSFDGGNTFTTTPISNYTPVLDRNWQAAYGANICYLSFVNGATSPGNFMEVVRMDYTAMAAPVLSPPSIVWDPVNVDPNKSHQKGNIVTDKRPGANTTLLMANANGAGNVYQCWTEDGHKVFVSRSTDFATTWTHHLVWDGGIGADYSHIFVWMACDDAGNLYIVFSDDRNVYLSTSTDRGDTWSRPVRVNRGSGASNACVFPQIVAGSPGRVAICFYGTSAPTPQDTSAVWAVYVSRSQNALVAAPDFQEVKVNDQPFHSGAVCEDGLNCATGRELCDNFDLDVNPVDGSIGLAYGVFGVSGTKMARQVKGLSLFASKTVTDRSTTCPTPASGCITSTVTGSPCNGPDYVTVVSDPSGTADVPPVALSNEDILTVGVGEPAGIGDQLVFTMRVSSIDPANLPPNAFWRWFFTPADGVQRYVDIQNCADAGLRSGYGHFTSTGSVRDGESDGYTIGTDGRLSVRIARSKAGNPAPSSYINAINADCRTMAGGCTTPAAFAPNDVTNSGMYKVVGNASCGVVATLIARFEARATAGNVELTWSAAAGGSIASWNLSRATTPEGPFELVNTTPIVSSGDEAVVWHDAPGAGTYYYRLSGLGADGAELATAATSTTAGGGSIAMAIRLAGENPFRGSTTLRYELPSSAHARVEVYNVAGQRVRTLVDRDEAAGSFAVPFTLRDGSHAPLPAGVYLVRLTAGQQSRSVRVIALN